MDKSAFRILCRSSILQIVFCSSPVSLSQNGEKARHPSAILFLHTMPPVLLPQGPNTKISVQRLSPDRNKFRLVHKRMFQEIAPLFGQAITQLPNNSILPDKLQWDVSPLWIGYHDIHLAHICTAVTAHTQTVIKFQRPCTAGNHRSRHFFHGSSCLRASARK